MDSPARTWTHRVVRDGLLLSVVFSAIIVGTALIDPWIMLENYPPAIRELVTPPDDLPAVLPVVIGVGMIVVLVWLMVRSVVALERDRGGHCCSRWSPPTHSRSRRPPPSSSVSPPLPGTCLPGAPRVSTR